MGGENPGKKRFGLLVNEKLGTTQQCVLTAQKANCILGSIKSSMVSREEEILPLCSGEIPSDVLGFSVTRKTWISWSKSREGTQN